MKRTLIFVWLVAVLLFAGAGYSTADSVDEHIKDLGSPNVDIRAKAAFELGCS
jgi:hypothetical protein